MQSSSNFLATIYFLCSHFLVSEWAVNNIKLLLHHCCHSKIELILIFLHQQQCFLFISHFHKDHKQENFILFNWSFSRKMWKKKIITVIYYLPPLYLVMKTICPCDIHRWSVASILFCIILSNCPKRLLCTMLALTHQGRPLSQS